MAYRLTPLAEAYASQQIIEPNLVLEIDGVSRVYGVTITKTEARYGVGGIRYGDPGLVYGGLAPLENSKDLISLTGTTTTIAQQLEPDKAATTSTSTITIKLVDTDEEITKLISPGVVVDDILQRDCTVYLGMKETAFPRDYIELFNGKIKTVSSGAGFVELTVAHPEDVKRSEIFTKAETVLVAPVNFFSLEVQDLFYLQRPDVGGTVEIEYIQTGNAGNSATVVVVGNRITVNLQQNAIAKNIKKVIENDEDANQLTTVRIKEGGNPNAQQMAFALTLFTVTLEIQVDDVSQFLLPTGNDLFRTYARINDEIIEYTSIDYNNNKLTGVTRASLTSFGASHETGDEVFSYYKLGDGTDVFGNAIDLALKVQLSGAKEFYAELSVSDIYAVWPSPVLENVILIPNIDASRKFGLTVGDTCNIIGASNMSNNVVNAEVLQIIYSDLGTYVQLDSTLITEFNTSATIKLKSRYNVLPDGIGLLPYQVDIQGVERLKATFGSGIAEYEFFLKESVNAKEFINKQILLPSALYSLPRKGRTSIGYTSPPLYDEGSKTLDLSTVLKPSQIKQNRSVDRNFYNAIVWRYDEDAVEDKNLKGLVRFSQDSVNRINSPTRPYTIEAKGLRPSQDTLELIDRNTTRFLSRYEFAAEFLSVEVPFKVGWTMEVGDTCLFGSEDLQLSDSSNGSRSFKPRVYEIINKELNWKTGFVQVTILDTNYDQGLRFGVYSPSTLVGVGSLVNQIKIVDSYGTRAPVKEREKWSQFIGKQILVHDQDYTQVYTTKLLGFASDDYTMIVSPALPVAPLEGWQIDAVNYDDLLDNESNIKSIHCFYDPTVTITASVDNQSFEVAMMDASKLFDGCIVRIHNDDYSIDSGLKGVKVLSVIGTTITLEDPLLFTPQPGHLIDLIGFASDMGAPYAYI